MPILEEKIENLRMKIEESLKVSHLNIYPHKELIVFNKPDGTYKILGDGSDERKISNKTALGWTTDGEKVILRDAIGIYTLDFKSNNENLIGNVERREHEFISPDARRIIYPSGEHRYNIEDIKSNKVSGISNVEFSGAYPFSPKGNRIVYNLLDTNEEYNSTWVIRDLNTWKTVKSDIKLKSGGFQWLTNDLLLKEGNGLKRYEWKISEDKNGALSGNMTECEISTKLSFIQIGNVSPTGLHGLYKDSSSMIILNIMDESVKKIDTKWNVDYSYSDIHWSPSGQRFAFIYGSKYDKTLPRSYLVISDLELNFKTIAQHADNPMWRPKHG